MTEKRRRRKGKPLSEKLMQKDRERTANLIGFLLGPYMLSEMHGRPPKVPPGYPSPRELQELPMARLQELKRQLQSFMLSTGGPDLTPEEAEQFKTFASLNPRVSTPRP